MPSIMATIGADATKFNSVMSALPTTAAETGKKVNGALAGGIQVSGDAHVKSGAMREALVLIRELSNGNFTRVPGSASLLIQQLGLLKYILNPIVGIIAGIAAGFLAAYKLSGALVEKLSGLKIPEIKLDYIAKAYQRINAAAEAQKEINREIKKSEELYNSAASAAQRVADATKEHFEHLRKMNDFAQERELKLASTEEEKSRIRQKYSQAGLLINAQERAEILKNKEAEAVALNAEALDKKRAGDAIRVNSKQYDEQELKNKKQMADEAQKYLDELSQSKGGAREKILRGYNAVALSGVSGADLDQAERDNRKEAQRRIQAAKDAADRVAENEQTRKEKESLYKEAGEAAAKAVTTALEAGTLKKTNAQKAKDEADEQKAKLAAEDLKQSKFRNPDVNALQKIGAYAPSQLETTGLDLSRKQEDHLRNIREGINTLVQRGAAGGTQF